MKILLLSDTHGQLDATIDVIQRNPYMDHYIHLGDIGFNRNELYHFDCVRGNHDREATLPMKLIKRYEERTILCIHGNLFDDETVSEVLALHTMDEENIMELCMRTLYHKLADYAKSQGCDTLFFGHTHHQVCVEVDDVILVNPGSLSFGTPHSGYAIVDIEGNKLQTTFYETKGIGNNTTE